VKLRYFDTSEFDCPIAGQGDKMDQSFLKALDNARHIASTPFRITSGYRCPEHNKNVGGVPGSSHTKFVACDIHCDDSARRFLIVSALLKAGITRIGISHNFIHCDMDLDKPQNLIWTYK
jgi:zinc D-Ala-D-Ala carboxypeptidase